MIDILEMLKEKKTILIVLPIFTEIVKSDELKNFLKDEGIFIGSF